MKTKKKKVLLLSTHDSHLAGHAWSCLKIYDKERYEVGLVSLFSLYGDKSYALHPNFLFYRIVTELLNLIQCFFVKKNNRYCYLRIFSYPVTVKQILKKYSLGIPDIIVLHWYDGFITPKLIKKIYEITRAKIVFVFTDEFPLGGGCHYPCDCKRYETDCLNCPALKRFKSIANRKLKRKIELLHNVPKYLIAPSAGLIKARSSAVFSKNTTYIREFKGYEIQNVPSFYNSRKNIGISEDDFVLMFGALNVDEERKGFKYLLEALNIVSANIERNILALIVGNISIPIKSFQNIEFRYLGTLPFDKLSEAYAASNVYISPSIADSGPMMLKFSIACGTPVVAFPVGYAMDFIKHKETGFLVNEISSEKLAEGILYFYDNSQYRNVYSEQCKKLNKEALNNDSTYNQL